MHDVDVITDAIIGSAIEVHRELGPGLLESAYAACLAYELRARKLPFDAEVEFPVRYRDLTLDARYRLDFLVASKVVVELKSVLRIEPVHEAQLLTYLRLTRCTVGLLINFNRPTLSGGIKRMVNGYVAQRPAS
ncbi:MAG: GxxExxY protein [Deltaproteobacteria bacterium]|nr:GxxExxY protein [Deltaproteobacteria bacterium]